MWTSIPTARWWPAGPLPTSITNPDGGIHTYTYDSNHRLTQEKFGLVENNWGDFLRTEVAVRTEVVAATARVVSSVVATNRSLAVSVLTGRRASVCCAYRCG